MNQKTLRETKEISLEILKIIALLIVAFLLFMEIYQFACIERIPKDQRISHSIILDPKLDGKLDLYYDSAGNFYWLKYTKPNSNKSKLIWRQGDVHGYVNVKVSGKNKVDLDYDYFEGEDKTVTIDIGKNQTKLVSYLRKLVERNY